jgi:peptidyl-prolyl cis-trans isomerase B (cyclophilin B)
MGRGTLSRSRKGPPARRPIREVVTRPTLVFFLLAAVCACRPQPPEAHHEPDAEATQAALARISTGPHDTAVLDLGDLGTIRIELLPELAPKTVAHFVSLAEHGVYDDTYFHRVIPGFMIQGGDPLTKNRDPRDDGTGKTTDRVPDEFSAYPHVRGTVSLANSGSPHSGGCQFFIVQQDSRQLDGSYSVFGRVSKGMETVDAITHLEIDRYGRYGPPDRPYPKDAVIRSVHIERASDTKTSHDPVAAPSSPG